VWRSSPHVLNDVRIFCYLSENLKITSRSKNFSDRSTKKPIGFSKESRQERNSPPWRGMCELSILDLTGTSGAVIG